MVRPGPGDADIQAKVDAGFVDIVERDLCMHQLNAKIAEERTYSDSSDSGETMWAVDSSAAYADEEEEVTDFEEAKFLLDSGYY